MTIDHKHYPQRTTLSSPDHPPYLWWQGELVPWDAAQVHVTSLGWPAISAVFEGIRGYWNEQRQELFVFRLDAHLARLARSMRFMRMAATYSPQDLTQAILALLRANGHRADAYCSPVVYLAQNIAGYLPASGIPCEAYITSRAATSALAVERASTACISTWTRLSDNVMPPRAKAITNYQNSRYVSTEAKLNGFDYGIVLNDHGKVAEGSHACIFRVRDGVACTPPTTAGILESITRDSVIALLHEAGVPVQERDIDRTELYLADEAFFVGTYVEIEAIGAIDHYVLGDGEPGPITRTLQQRFESVVRGRDERHAAWLTPVYAGVAAEPRP
jgi:branched-chain amino acid aminotransferase